MPQGVLPLMGQIYLVCLRTAENTGKSLNINAIRMRHENCKL